MSVLVKICGLTDLGAVNAAVAAGADALGFVFAESVRRITPERARSITAAVPPRVLRVAVMLHPSAAEWAAVLDGFGPDVLQTDAADFAALDLPSRIRRWPVLRQGEGQGEDGSALPAEFVYEGRVSGRGERVDWSLAARLARRGNMILAGGLDADNVAGAIAVVRPFGVDVSSAVEAAPGRKDPARIEAFIRAARSAGAEVHAQAD